ncbi:hypothetical protein F5X96DRAFT_643374 [Biscogniauxia mediterranea]|nr:hypothetical protein F5X96DRAFT_643374 [Biscogniauxia mediterranea]
MIPTADLAAWYIDVWTGRSTTSAPAPPSSPTSAAVSMVCDKLKLDWQGEGGASCASSCGLCSSCSASTTTWSCLSGRSNEDDRWTFGQVLSLATWCPVLVDYAAVLMCMCLSHSLRNGKRKG